MSRFHKIIAGAAGALTLVVMTSTLAALPDAPGGCAGAGTGHMAMVHGGMRGEHGEHGALAEQHLAAFKTQLKITAAQEPAWSAFAAQASAQAKAMQAQHARHQQAADAKTTAPERMAQHIDQMKLRLAGMEAMNASVKELYAALTPEQRSIADQQLGRMGHHGMGRGHGMRG